MNRVFSKVYGTELEKVEVFNGFQDFVETFHIHRGKVKSKSEEEETIVGEFKASKVRILESVLKHVLWILSYVGHVKTTFKLKETRK